MVRVCKEQRTSLAQFGWNSLQFSNSVGSSPHHDLDTKGTAIMFSINDSPFVLRVHNGSNGAPELSFDLKHCVIAFEPGRSHSTTASGKCKVLTAFFSTRNLDPQWDETMRELGFAAPSGDTKPSTRGPSGDQALPRGEQEPLPTEASPGDPEVGEERVQLSRSPKVILRIYIRKLFPGKRPGS